MREDMGVLYWKPCPSMCEDHSRVLCSGFRVRSEFWVPFEPGTELELRTNSEL